MWVVKVGLRELHVCVVNCQSPTPEDTEDDQLLVRQRLLRQQKKTEMVAESSDTATIKKLHVSSANLQRVSTTSCYIHQFTISCYSCCWVRFSVAVIRSE